MRSEWRAGRIVALVLCAIVLLVVGLDGLRTLVGVGKEPSEFQESQVAYTVGALVLGITIIIWCCTEDFRRIARTQRSRQDAGAEGVRSRASGNAREGI